jgi:hypothetical protein
MWNIAAGISGLENVNETYFQWKSTQASNGSDKGPSWETYSNFFSLVVQMRKWEIENNVIFEEAIVRKLGGANLWLANAENSARLDPAKGTFVRQVLCAMIQKGVESRRARAAGIKRGPSKKRLLAAAAALRAKAMKVELAIVAEATKAACMRAKAAEKEAARQKKARDLAVEQEARKQKVREEEAFKEAVKYAAEVALRQATSDIEAKWNDLLQFYHYDSLSLERQRLPDRRGYLCKTTDSKA